MAKKQDAQFFLDKLSKIPANKWTVGEWKNEKGQRCVQGHLGSTNGKTTKQTEVIEKLFKDAGYQGAMAVNDNGSSKLGKTPRARILAVLKKLVAKDKAAKKAAKKVKKS